MGTSEKAKKIDLGLWYNTNDLGVFSIAYEQPNMIIGASYDIPVGNELSQGQNSIFELALAIRLKRKKKTEAAKQAMETDKLAPEEDGPSAEEENDKNDVEDKPEEIDPEPTQEAAEDDSSSATKQEPTRGTDEPKGTDQGPTPTGAVKEVPKKKTVTQDLTPIEEKILAGKVRFALDSDELTPESKGYLGEVVKVMNENI